MNLQTIKNQKGFTIVELLIVVVVIGILAAITIVAFTGIQNNARNSERQSDASSIAKFAEAINAQVGRYPQTAAEFNNPATEFSITPSATLPDNITVSTPGTIPAITNTNGPAVASGEKTYIVEPCGANNGVEVHYFDPRGSGVATSVRAGSGGSC